MTILEKLIKELTTETTLSEKKIKQLFNEELKETNSEEEAAKNVRTRVKFLFIYLEAPIE